MRSFFTLAKRRKETQLVGAMRKVSTTVDAVLQTLDYRKTWRLNHYYKSIPIILASYPDMTQQTKGCDVGGLA